MSALLCLTIKIISLIIIGKYNKSKINQKPHLELHNIFIKSPVKDYAPDLQPQLQSSKRSQFDRLDLGKDNRGFEEVEIYIIPNLMRNNYQKLVYLDKNDNLQDRFIYKFITAYQKTN